MVVVGHGADNVVEVMGDRARVVYQLEQKGTGHAVLMASDTLRGRGDYILVMYGDMPLLRPETLASLLTAQVAHTGPVTLLTMLTDTPRGFGRILRQGGGSVAAIIEAAHATPEQLAIREVNVGVYCFSSEWLLSHLPLIPVSPKGEYYLTDLVGMAVGEGLSVQALLLEDISEAIGINTRVHLSEAEAILRKRVNEHWMLEGVTILDPATTYIEPSVTLAPDTTILPGTMLRGTTSIGQSCTIGPETVITDSTVGSRCRVVSSVIEGATIEADCSVGPFGHLRKGAYLEQGVHMGNFGEVKNSRLRRGVKMGHFSYIGDGDIGEGTNIGAGTITCNYDGKAKHKTKTGRNVFIGSGTMLVAPVSLDDDSRTGAGAVVTHDVEQGVTVVGVPARPITKKNEQVK